MYVNAKSWVHLNGQFIDDFDIKADADQGAALSPLLFIIVMEALSRKFEVGCPWKMLYADNLVLMVETLEALKKNLTIW